MLTRELEFLSAEAMFDCLCFYSIPYSYGTQVFIKFSTSNMHTATQRRGILKEQYNNWKRETQKRIKVACHKLVVEETIRFFFIFFISK